jgi:hypothetical protein
MLWSVESVPKFGSHEYLLAFHNAVLDGPSKPFTSFLLISIVTSTIQ